MKGDSVQLGSAYYGSIGIESPLNKPPSSDEIGISWVDNENNFWLLDNIGCLWKYKTTTDNWIWMKGNNIDSLGPYQLPNYGIKGVEDSSNTPGFNHFNYSKWKDSYGNFWYLQGQNMVLWKYNLSTNNWTWVNGDTSNPTFPNYGTSECIQTGVQEIKPYSHEESRACWIDNCNNLWLMGGYAYNSISGILLNDLIFYNVDSNRWVWVGNDTSLNLTGNYGTMGIASPSNVPASRTGALPFKDNIGNIWVFGGLNSTWTGSFADLWMYTIDTSCTKCHAMPLSLTQTSNLQVDSYPNPATTTISITSSQPITQITITNIIGQILYSNVFKKEDVLIDVSSLPIGMYFITISGSEVRKLFK